MRWACTKAEVSCIIGNLFAELRPPCAACGAERLTIAGRTVTGNEGTLTVTDWGFEFEGSEEDAEIIGDIRKGRCPYAKAAASKQADNGIRRDSKGEGHGEAYLRTNQQHQSLSEEVALYLGEPDAGQGHADIRMRGGGQRT